MTYLLNLDGQLSEEDKKQLEGIKAEVAKIKNLKEADEYIQIHGNVAEYVIADIAAFIKKKGI